MYQTILIGLDGSDQSLIGGRIGLRLALACGAELIACHVYGARLHDDRFKDMEPGLEAEYQDQAFLKDLRHSHSNLILDGLLSLSQGYMDDFTAEAKEAGAEIEPINVEGRNFVGLLDLAKERQADLIILGAHGLGRLEDNRMGSTARRVLRSAECDLLIARKTPAGSGIGVGIDGSPEALAAFRRAIGWAGLLETGLTLAAVYDPVFHNHVFQAMAKTLSPERQAEVGLAKQEELHRKIIDEGLGKLYRSFLDRARAKAQGLGWPGPEQPPAELLQGKVYRAVLDDLQTRAGDLLVMGRHGHHREPGTEIGSNVEAVAELAETNVLITAAGEQLDPDPQEEMTWEPEAEERLSLIPVGPRKMAQRAIEDEAKSQGLATVTLEIFQTVARRFGMGG